MWYIIDMKKELIHMILFKKMLTYLAHKYTKKQTKVRQQNNRNQIKLILKSL